ncbi:5351_t:CDS:10 [Dentiscutata erythropus]|uniref:5351_t:CDS:1 n=1 Tax=Dentiscutata erythropus TaxID=1348616 RepID=A0A9N8YTD2_9GLOM|nr:5351_t:CDS:10 [Dentiscutata erythropus]
MFEENLFNMRKIQLLITMVFESKHPKIQIPQEGIYQYMTSNPEKIPDNKVIYIDGITGKTITYGEFKHESKKFAAGLQDKLEFKRGKVTTANPKYRATELSYQLTDSGASVLIVHPEFLETAIEASIEAKIPSSRVLLFGDEEIKGYKPYRSVLIGDREIEPVSYTPEEARTTTAYLPYSSGTTGKQKGVELTHTNINVNLAQLIGSNCGLGPHSIFMGLLPFFHIYALTCILHGTLIHGATTIILPCFNVETFCEAIQKYRINQIHAVPPIILKLVNDPVVQNFDISSVNLILSAAAPLSDELEKKFNEMYKVPILQAYGLTETSPILHYPDTKNINNSVPGSIGYLLPNVKAKILSESGDELGYNEPGEMWVHGPNVMKGYLNNKEATNAVFDKDGFFNTGDIACVDEQGNFFIVDRKKELIKYKGFQVAPAELEAVLLTHDAVSDTAVIGYYSEEEATELPIAYVTVKHGYEQSQALAKEIQSFVGGKVAPHKKLRGGILFINKIPKSDSGKILRRLLREKLKNEKMN